MLRKRSLMYPLFGVCLFLTNAHAVQTMYGSVAISDMAMSNEIKIVGMGDLKDSVFDKDVRVVGYLKSQNSHFLADIYTVGSDLSLSHDEVEGDVHITNYIKTPRVYLSNSTIKGKIIFHGRKRGKVIKDSGSIINGIENGDMQ